MDKIHLRRLTNLFGGYWYQDTLSFDEGIESIFREQSVNEIHSHVQLIEEFLSDEEMNNVEKTQYIVETVDGEDFSLINPILWVQKVRDELQLRLITNEATADPRAGGTPTSGSCLRKH